MKNIFKTIAVLVFLANTNHVTSQIITSGPVIGGVKQNEAKVYVRTGTSGRAFTLELDTNLAFSSPRILNDSTRTSLFGAVTFRISNLKPNTRYYGRFRFGTIYDSLSFSFRTFPDSTSREPLRIVVGSCNYSPNSPLFRQIKNLDPHLFLHLVDIHDNYHPSEWKEQLNKLKLHSHIWELTNETLAMLR